MAIEPRPSQRPAKHPHVLRPPWLRATSTRGRVDAAGQAAAIFGAVAIVGGNVVAVVGWHSATLVAGDPGQYAALLWWMRVGTTLAVVGVAALVLGLVLGLVAVVVARLR